MPRLNNQTASNKKTVLLRLPWMIPDLKIQMAGRRSSDCPVRPGSRPSNVTRKRRTCAASKSWWNMRIHVSRSYTRSKRSSCLGPKSTTSLKTYCNLSGKQGALTRKAKLLAPSRALLRPYMWCKAEMIRRRQAMWDSRLILQRRSNIQTLSTTILVPT